MIASWPAFAATDLIQRPDSRTLRPRKGAPMAEGRRIVWVNVVTVISAADPDRRRSVRRRLRRLMGARHLVRSRRDRRAGARRSVRALRPRRHGAVHPRRAQHRAVHRARLSASRSIAEAKVKKVFWCGEQNRLHNSKKMLFRLCPISHVPVAVCRSVGSRTKGRPAAWREKPKLSKKSDRQLEAKPAHSALSRGRGLKQRRSGFLGLCRSPPPARVTEEACSSLPAVRTGLSPSNPRQFERDTMCSVGASPLRADAYASLTAT